MDPKPAQPPRAQRARTATWRLAVLLVVIAGITIVLANSLRVYFAQAQEIAAVKADIAATQEQIADLEDRLNRWEDPAYVRSVARVRLGWVMPGEVGYRVLGVDGQPLEGPSIETALDVEVPGLWWEKMWGSVQAADVPAPDPGGAALPDPQQTIQSPTPSPTP